jgi:hypothetical protein
VTSVRRTLVLVCLAACGPADVPLLNMEVCRELGAAICARAADCAPTKLPDSMCTTDFIMGCCSADTCNQPSNGVYFPEMQQCTKDIADFDCTQLGLGHLPDSCPPPSVR